ncbi:gamma-glutamylcyclotransferase-like [Saccostrea echinata]|uniref:gamma-glutamylcyclotransferase-like n=1 Tax=Saccostrea echinata TaxID=191078 RepID=UPI002A7F7F85|nr:gamma-glutamylcyclotransferase-like [Saccostrea echinata]
MTETFLYFAYGSNLLRQRLTLQNPSAVFKGVGHLKNFRLDFKSPSDPKISRWRGAAATIEPHPEGTVWGVIWRLDAKDKASLDRQEGIYDAINVEVITPDNKTYSNCRTYVMQKAYITDRYDNRPSPHYKDVLVRGAQQNNIPQAYIEFLQNLDDNGYSGNIPVYNQVLDSLKQS